jgi:DNA-binding response OmpR family regulator
MAKGKILVIDDDHIILELLHLTLGQADYEVITAQDGESGIKEFKEQKPDLVIADIAMPASDGFEVVTDIRSFESEGTHTPIIILTAHDQPGMRDYAQEIGADLYLTKPIAGPPFMDKIERLMKSSPKQ